MSTYVHDFFPFLHRFFHFITSMKSLVHLVLVSIPLFFFQNIHSYSQSSSTGSIKIYSLDECMKIADSANLDMMIAMAQIPAAQANQKAAFGGYLPQVNASMGYSRRLNQLGGGQFNIGGFRAPADQYSASTLANITLFNGFSREANIDLANSNINATLQTVEQTRNQVKLAVIQQFLTILRNAKLVAVRSENLLLGKKELERAKARFEAGVAPIAIIYAQEADNGNRELELVQAENQVNIAKANLLSTMAHSPGEKAEFAENSFPTEITESEISNFRSKFSSVDEAYAQALANRPDFAAAKSRIEASKFSIIASKSGYYPSISATGGWSWANSEIKDFDLFGRSFVALNVDIPLFDAFRTNQQIQNAELQSKQNELEKERTQQTIRIQLQSGLLNVYSAEKQLEITNRSIVAANQNFESAKERFEVGTATIVDYLTANTQLITAKINRVNAVYNYFDAQVQVKFALGSM